MNLMTCGNQTRNELPSDRSRRTCHNTLITDSLVVARTCAAARLRPVTVGRTATQLQRFEFVEQLITHTPRDKPAARPVTPPCERAPRPQPRDFLELLDEFGR